MIEKAEFIEINEYFEIIFNAAEATQIVFNAAKISSCGAERGSLIDNSFDLGVGYVFCRS
jgi:hypothetical protein